MRRLGLYQYFQQYCRLQRVTAFVFCKIPALPRGLRSRSFVFSNIPASFVHFSMLVGFPEPQGKMRYWHVLATGRPSSHSPESRVPSPGLSFPFLLFPTYHLPPFVFMQIPALFAHFLKLLVSRNT